MKATGSVGFGYMNDILGPETAHGGIDKPRTRVIGIREGFV